MGTQLVWVSNAGKWSEEQRRLQRDIERHEEAEQSYMEEGLRILELARNAQALFERQPARETRRLPNFVLSNCTWEDGQAVATFRQPFDLLAQTAAIGWQNLRGDRLQYRRQKTEGVSTVLIDIPVHPELRKVLETLPKAKLTFLETRGGRSRTANGLGTAMRKWCDDASLPKCSAHGLRKACATRLAEAGATEREIMAWTGHNSPTMVQVYAGKARRGILADHGFEKLMKNEQGSKLDEPNKKGSTK